MDLILAMDLQHGTVVHGKGGTRKHYMPLDWGYTRSAEPVQFVSKIGPKYLYVADLDRIEGTGSHDDTIRACANLVTRCYVDRGIRTPDEYLEGDHIVNVVGTETCGGNLSKYHGGFLSIDIKHGIVIPTGCKPIDILVEADQLHFEGCIILNLGAVGTLSGVNLSDLHLMRSAYSKDLIYGGGVATIDDLYRIDEAGFDGVIVATAVHRGIIPLKWMQEGYLC